MNYKHLMKGLLLPWLGAFPVLAGEVLLLTRIINWEQFHLSEFIRYLLLMGILFSIFGLSAFIGWMYVLKGLADKRKSLITKTLSLWIWSLILPFSLVLTALFGALYLFFDLSRPTQLLVYGLMFTSLIFVCGLSLGLHIKGRKAAIAAIGSIVIVALAGEIAMALSYIGPLHDYFYFVEMTIVLFSGLVLAIPLMLLALHYSESVKWSETHPVIEVFAKSLDLFLMLQVEWFPVLLCKLTPRKD